MSNMSVINKMATLGSVAKTAAPKVGRTLGTLNSKKVALGTTASVGQNLTDRIQNAQGKIQELGSDVPKPKTTALGWLLENLPRTGYGATNMVRELLQPDEGLTPGEFDPLAAWMRGFRKVEQPLGKDIMTGFGLEGDKAMLTGGDPHIYNPSAAGLAGLLLDIFNPADPLNWIGFGTGGAVKSGGLRGVKALEKSFGSQSAKRIASLLGDEAVSDVGARSVGRIIKQVTEGGKKIGLDETGMKNLIDYLKQGMSEAGTNPKTKVNYWQGKPITVGLQNPLTLGLKGNFAEFAVPGSEHLTGAISKGINKFKQTRVGDTLGEMFEVGHVSKDAPQKLFVRSTTKDLDELVKRHRQGKIKLPATAKEIAAMKEDLNKISLVNVYDTNTATRGINFDLLAGIVGVDSGTLMELFDQRLPFTYNIGELFKVFKKADIEDAVAFRQSVMLRGVMDKLIDIIPNEYRGLFKGTVMTPGIGVEYFKGTLADNVGNIRNAASPYINYIFERDGVGIAIPVNVGENFNEAVWKKLDTAVAAIDELPAEVKKKIVQDIQIAPHNLGEYVDEKTGIKTIDPQGMTLHGQITLADSDIMMDTLKHESGHIVWQNNPELADRYVQAAQQEISQGRSIGVTDYGYAHIANTAGEASERESFKEDFAEAIYRALTDPELFIQEHPLRAKVIQEAIYDGSITPDELVAIKEVAEARADKIAKSYGVRKQLDSVLNGVDDAVEDVMMNGSEDMIDAQMATKQFTRDITRVFEKALSTGEDFRLAIKQIWKNVSPEESREILRIASELDSSAMRSMSDPSFLDMTSQSDKVKYNQITKEWKQSWEPYYEVKTKMLMPGELDINGQRVFTGQEPGRYRIPTDMTANQYPTHMFDIIDKNTGEVVTTLTSKHRQSPSMTVAMIEAFRRNPELATKYGIKPQPDLLSKSVTPSSWVQESAVPSFFNAQKVETPENLYRIVGSDALDESGNLRPIRSGQYGTFWAPSIDDLEGWSHEIIRDWVNGDEVHLIKINSNKDMKIINADDAEFQIDFVRKLKDRYGFNYEQWVKNQYSGRVDGTRWEKVIQFDIEEFYNGEVTHQINRLLDMAEDASVPQGKIKDLIEADGLYSTETLDDFGAEIFIPDNIENKITDRRTIDGGAYLDGETDFPSFYSAGDVKSMYDKIYTIKENDNYKLHFAHSDPETTARRFTTYWNNKAIIKQKDEMSLKDARQDYRLYDGPEKYGRFSKSNYTKHIIDMLDDDLHEAIQEIAEGAESIVDIGLNPMPKDSELELMEIMANLLSWRIFPFEVDDSLSRKLLDLMLEEDLGAGVNSGWLSGSQKYSLIDSRTGRVVQSSNDYDYLTRYRDNYTPEAREASRRLGNNDAPSFYSAINDRLNPTYYSRLRQVVDEKMSNSMPVEDLKNMLKSNGVKDEEIKWTFLDEFFDAKGGKVTKEEVQQWLDWNNLEVQEIMKRPTAEQARAKELLDRFGNEEVGALIDDLYDKLYDDLYDGLTDRNDILKAIADEYNLSIEDADLLETSISDPEYFQELSGRNATSWGQHTEPGGKDYREIIFTLPLDYNTPKTGPESISSFNEPAYTKYGHWPGVNNPVGHARFNTRYTPEGKKILFIEELQSDWHQEGWTKGYKDIESVREYKRKYEELKTKRNKRYQELYHQFVKEPGITDMRADEILLTFDNHPEIQTITKEMKELGLELQGLIADAPFKNTWRELTLKRLVKYASEEGFDGISWTTGAQQNKRWSQAEEVGFITYSPKTKSLTAYHRWLNNDFKVHKAITIESEKDLKKYLTNEQIAKLTDSTPLELKVKPVEGWDSNIDPYDLALEDMGAVELYRLMDQKGSYYNKFEIVDQYGNKFPYLYDNEADALKAIDDYYTADQGLKVLSQGDLQWGGGGFRLSYDERIPQDMEKLTKRFKLKTEDINLGKSSSELIDQLKAIDDGGGVDVIDEFVDRFAEDGVVEENLLTDIVDNFLIAANRNELSPTEAEALSEYIITRIKDVIEIFGDIRADEIPSMPYVEDMIRSATNKTVKLSDDHLPPRIQKGIMFTDDAKDFFRENAFPLFKKTNNIDPDIQNVDEAISHLSEEAQNAFREFIKWRESIVKEYQKRDIPINVLEKYVPFVFTRKGTADEMLALNALFGTGSMPEADNLSSLINWLSGYDPNLKPRTTQATNPLEVNKVLKKPILSEDGAVIMATRGTRAIQATELYDFAEEFMGQYGRTVDEMAEYGNIKGYSLYKPKTTPDGRRVFEKVTSANKIMDNDPSVMFLPEELVKIYNDYTDMVFGKQGMNRLLKTYDKATGLYKKLAYLWNPGHIMRDFTGNVFNGYLMGLTNPKYYKEAFDYMMNPDMMVKVPGFTDMTAKQFMSKCRQNGVLDIGSSLAEFAGDPVIGMKKGKNPAMKALNGYGWAMRMGTRQSDTFTRLAGMLYQLRQGRSFDEAAVQVKKFYFDYFELTSFERNVMKRIIPFYTWMRKNIPLQLEMMIKNPRELARVSDAMNAAAGEPINWSEQPEYIQEAGAFPLGNLNHYLSPNLPYSDLSRGIPNLETAKNWLSAVNPIIRAPIELATNTQWFNGRPIENYGGEQRDLPLAGLLRALGVETPTVSKRGAGYLADQIPLLRNLDAVTNPDNPRQMEKASTFLGGPGLYKKDAVQTSSQYEYLKLLQDLIRLLQEQNQNIVK